MKCCGECPFLKDCRQILDVDESTTWSGDCPILEQITDNFIKRLIQKIAEVIVKAQRDRQG